MKLRIGPGLLLAIVASVIVWYVTAPPGPPRVERTLVGSSVPAPPSAPDPDFVAGLDLGLTGAQRKQMDALHGRWQRDTADLRAAIEAAQRDLAAAASASPVQMQDVQARGATLSELSRNLATARRAWWDDASRLLSAEQRRAAEDAWEKKLRGGGR